MKINLFILGQLLWPVTNLFALHFIPGFIRQESLHHVFCQESQHASGNLCQETHNRTQKKGHGLHQDTQRIARQ